MKIAIGICNSQDVIKSRFFWSFLEMRNPYLTTYIKGSHPWDVVRNNQLITGFLKSDCDVFIKMDVDQVYPDNYLEVMVPLTRLYDVIGPMIYDRHLESGFMPLCFEKDNNEPFARRGKAFDGKTGIKQLPYLHTNCFYNRHVLESLKPPYYEAYLNENGLGRANHVDYTFMRKIVDNGHKIFINFDMVVAHIAEVPIWRYNYERWNRLC